MLKEKVFNYIEKELPQPHVLAALGLTTTNLDP